MDRNTLNNAIGTLLTRCTYVEDGAVCKLTTGADDEMLGAEIDSGEIDRIIEKVLQLKFDQQMSALCGENSIEIPITQARANVYSPGLLREPLNLEDADNGLTYSLAPPSAEYAVAVLLAWHSTNPTRSQITNLRRRVFGRSPNFDNLEGIERFWKLILSQIPIKATVRVQSRESRSSEQMRRLSESFLFQIGYNLDQSLVEIRSIFSVLEESKLRRVRNRRSSVSELDPPRRIYLPDLLYHYRMALSSDSPYLQYLSFYHVAEHFFEEVYNDELIKTLTDKLTSPGFSYRRKSDIKELASVVQKWTKKHREDVALDEQTALTLTLRRFVNCNRVLDELNQYDQSLVLFYQTSPIDFAEADSLDLLEKDSERLLKRLSARIYKVRNALVHSKDGKRPKYIPFRHDDLLAREVPLLRFIAEEIIVASSAAIE